jgi:hypothetical protein
MRSIRCRLLQSLRTLARQWTGRVAIEHSLGEGNEVRCPTDHLHCVLQPNWHALNRWIGTAGQSDLSSESGSSSTFARAKMHLPDHTSSVQSGKFTSAPVLGCTMEAEQDGLRQTSRVNVRSRGGRDDLQSPIPV